MIIDSLNEIIEEETEISELKIFDLLKAIDSNAYKILYGNNFSDGEKFAAVDDLSRVVDLFKSFGRGNSPPISAHLNRLVGYCIASFSVNRGLANKLSSFLIKMSDLNRANFDCIEEKLRKEIGIQNLDVDLKKWLEVILEIVSINIFDREDESSIRAQQLSREQAAKRLEPGQGYWQKMARDYPMSVPFAALILQS